jgi:hypothetical protein
MTLSQKSARRLGTLGRQGGQKMNGEQASADARLQIYEKLIGQLPYRSSEQKFVQQMAILFKLKARPWLKESERRTITIKINEVHRNEQINIVAICAGHQILMCDREMHPTREYYLLVPMKGITTPLGPDKNRVYKRNYYGNEFQMLINSAGLWGDKLESFPCRYVAQVFRRLVLPLEPEYSLKFWKEIEREGFFDFWDPQGGPIQWHKDHRLAHVELPILRVFELDQDLRPLVKYSDGFGHLPFLSEKGIEASAVPVLTDEEFNVESQRLLRITARYHYS